MKSKVTRIILLLLITGVATQLFSQTKNGKSEYVKMKNLETVSVTAERFPVKEKETPRFITITTKSELKRTGANNLIDALKRIGGLTYKSFGPLGITQGGMNSEVAIRGINGGEMVMINGVSIQGAAGRAYDLNLLSIDQIERIEVVKGAASALYGSNAMSGVINIVTRKTSEKTSLKIGLEGGNMEYYHTKLRGEYKNLVIAFEYQGLGRQDRISYNYSKKYSYRNAPAKKYSWSANYKFLDNFYIDYIGAHNKTTYEKVYDDPSKSLIGKHQIQNKNFVNLRYENENLRVKTYLNYDLLMRDEYTKQSVPDNNNKNYNYGIDADYNFDVSGFALTTGSNWVYRAADYNTKYNHKYDMHTALFLQVKKKFFRKLDMILGARQQFVNGGSQDKDYNIFLPSAGLTLNLSEKTNVFASFGKAFRTPTFNNLYYKSDLVEGNDALEPEKGYTYETGLKFDNDILSFRVSGFYMDYQDKIELDRSGSVSKYVNAGEYKSSGIEWRFDLMSYRILNIPLIFTTSGFYADPTAKIEDGEEQQMGPKVQVAAGLKYFTNELTVELNSNLTAKRERNLDDYLAINLFASYKIWKGKLHISVDNIFDRENFTYGNLTPTSKSRYAYFDLGRQFKFGYEFNL
ncbi:MAG: TonB-dependent receptor [Rhodothermaceae bacterium]